MSILSDQQLKPLAQKEPTSQALARPLVLMLVQDTMLTRPEQSLRQPALQALTIRTQDQPVQLHVLLHLQDTMLTLPEQPIRQPVQQGPINHLQVSHLAQTRRLDIMFLVQDLQPKLLVQRELINQILDKPLVMMQMQVTM